MEEEYEEEEEHLNEPFMYFISKGVFAVTVKQDHLNPDPLNDEMSLNKGNEQILLYEGAHFGEIGLLYDCKRTATVCSQNYGTLAKLKKSHFVELLKTFDNISTLFKKYIFKY